MSKEYEYINSPKHYNREGKKECIVLMEEIFGKYWTAIFCVINAFKYKYRCGDKPSESVDRDLMKAAWYIDRAKSYLPFLRHRHMMKISKMIILVNEDYDYEN